ncbi:rhodanese-like domain-containing protein [Planomonospora parontospora]|nr:rhodanese-like domain-containing protein [Planomonospora parontospora]
MMTIRETTIAELRRSDLTGTVLLDVRTRPEFASGHLAGAVNVPLDELGPHLAGYAGKDVVTVCLSGGRSAVAAQALQNAGARVRSLAGGTNAWQRAGLPLEKGR